MLDSSSNEKIELNISGLNKVESYLEDLESISE